MSNIEGNWWTTPRKCPCCKKEFYVVDPEIWAYKIVLPDNWRYKLYCSWHCLQAVRKKKKKTPTKGQKIIEQYDLDGNLVATHIGGSAAADVVDGYECSIAEACRGVYRISCGATDGHYYKGYRWFYKDVKKENKGEKK